MDFKAHIAFMHRYNTELTAAGEFVAAEGLNVPGEAKVVRAGKDGTPVTDGERLAYLPGRGFHRRAVSINGDVVVGEERLRGLLRRARTAEDYEHGLSELLGIAWDVELEPYRLGGDGAPVTLLHQVV